MKKWKVLTKVKSQKSKVKIDQIIKILLMNREIKTKKEVEEFLYPKLSNITINNLAIDSKQLNKTVLRIKKAIKNKEQIVVFGDYDVDGICGTAILWETLNSLGAKVMPYIPHRIDEGYGLSVKAIQNSEFKIQNVKLIITVDNGIVANKAVDFANENGIDVIITDHHVASKTLPKAFSIVHTIKLCGTAVAYILSQEILKILNTKYLIHNTHLELVALATVADLVPLKGANRTLLKFGLEALRKTKRIGLLELFKEAGLQQDVIGVYEIGHMIAPRLNAMGRLEYAMDSLRLICTNNQKRAEDLAQLLGSTNKQRQELTFDSALHAITKVKSQKSPLRQGFEGQAKLKKLLFISHESYEQGVIGLIAGKLVEEFYRPSIVISIGEKLSKASARSVSGFNIIEFIRESSELLIDAGGHPMAAGFTFETTKLIILQKAMEERAEKMIDEDMLTRSLKIDLEIPLSLVDIDLYNSLQKLSPFGMGNPEPTFVSRGVIVGDMRTVGKENKHLKLRLSYDSHSGKRGTSASRNPMGNKRFWTSQNDGLKDFDGIAFGMGEMSSKIHIGDKIDIAYVIDENEWNGNKTLQLKIRDTKL